LLNSGRNSWYCFGMTSCNGLSLRSFASIALLISYKEALRMVSFPYLTVRKNEAPFNIMILPRNGFGFRISAVQSFFSW
jgi:hypothetical protein